MFNNPKYLTRGVQSTIPSWLVILLWHLIEIMPVEDDSVKRSDGSQIIQVKYFIAIPNDEPSMSWYVVNRIPVSTVDAVLNSFDDNEDDTNVQVVLIGVRYDRPNRLF